MKSAFVTGASRGIGLEIAKSFNENGYEVTGTYYKTKPSELDGIKYLKADLSIREETIILLDRVKDKKFDCVVNCAGVFEEESIKKFDLEKWDKEIELMLTVPYLISHELSKKMPKGSTIINIVSTDAFRGAYEGFGYSVAKAGLVNLTKSLGNVLAEKNIRVNAVAPGWVDTDMGPGDTDFSEAVKSIIPLKRIAGPKEIADVVVFLASEKSKYINGETLTVDGGLSNVDPSLLAESGN